MVRPGYDPSARTTRRTGRGALRLVVRRSRRNLSARRTRSSAAGDVRRRRGVPGAELRQRLSGRGATGRCARSTAPDCAVFERETLLAKSNFTRDRVAKFAVLAPGPGRVSGADPREAGEKDLAAASGEVLLSMNLWRFSPRIFEACRRVPRSARGELRAAAGGRLGDRRISGSGSGPCGPADGVLDLSTRADVAAVSERLRGVEARP